MDDHTDVVFRKVHSRLRLSVRSRIRRFRDLDIEEDEILSAVYVKLKERRIELSPDDLISAAPGTDMPGWLHPHYMWCLRCARDEVSKVKKRRIRRRRKIEKVDELATPDDDPLPQAKIENQERSESIEEALMTLDADTEMIVRLHVYDNMTFAEISSVMKTSIGSVKGKWRRGCHKLEARLAPHSTNFMEDR